MLARYRIIYIYIYILVLQVLQVIILSLWKIHTYYQCQIVLLWILYICSTQVIYKNTLHLSYTSHIFLNSCVLNYSKFFTSLNSFSPVLEFAFLTLMNTDTNFHYGNYHITLYLLFLLFLFIYTGVINIDKKYKLLYLLINIIDNTFLHFNN